MAQSMPAGSQATSRRQQPRRKASSAQQSRRRRSFEADRVSMPYLDHRFSTDWVHYKAHSEHNIQMCGDDEDAMQIEKTPALSRQEALRAAHPLRDMADRVGREVEDFAERLDAWKPRSWGMKSSERKSAFELVKEYRTIADTTVAHLRERHESSQVRQLRHAWREKLDPSAPRDDYTSDSDEEDAETSPQDVQTWQAELNTWRLLEELGPTMFPDTRPRTPDKGRNKIPDYGNDRFAADGAIWRDFLANDNIARSRHIILKWLEECAERGSADVELIEEEMKYCSERGDALFSKGWIDTRERIKAEKVSRNWNTGSDILPDIEGTDGQSVVQQLDPDAPTRLQLALDAADQTFERSVWIVCWEHLRRGLAMDKICDWCELHNENARAVMLGAYAVAPDKNASQEKNIAVRYRWRKACQAAASCGCQNEYECAVLGLLTGDVKALEPVAESWEDLCFAHYNALLLAQYKVYLGQAHPHFLPHEKLYNFGENDAVDVHESAHKTLRSIKAHALLRDAPQTPQAVIQQSIIAGEISQLFFQQGVLLSRRARNSENNMLVLANFADMLPRENRITNLIDDKDGLRVLAHSFMILQYLGLEFESKRHKDAAENVFIAYIEFLVLAGKDRLIPSYAARLSSEQAVSTLALVLPLIVKSNMRIEYVTLMQESKLPMILVFKQQYENAKQQLRQDRDDSQPFASFDNLEAKKEDLWPGARVKAREDGITPAEHLILDSLDWYLLIDDFWYETFEMLTNGAILLLENGSIQAAAELFKRIPARAVSLKKSSSILGKRLDIIDEEDMGIDVKRGRATSTTKRGRRRRSSLGSKEQKLQAKDPLTARQAMQLQAKCFYELEELVHAVRMFWDWRNAEQRRISLRSERTTGDQNQDSQEAVLRALDAVKTSMDPLLEPRFLTSPPPPNYQQDLFAGAADLEARLTHIREAYLTSLILAYNSVLHSAGHLVSRDSFISSLELADAAASDEELTRCFVVSGRMREFVKALAATSKAMLKLNQGKKNDTKRRGPRTLGIWDVSV